MVIQVFTGNARFFSLSFYPAITAAIQNYRLIQPTSMNETLWNLVEGCWGAEPKSRPTISDIVQGLKLHLGTMQRPGTCPCEWDQGIMSRLRSPALISPLLESPVSLQGDKVLDITSKDTIIV